MSTERGKRYTAEQKQELLELFRQSGLNASRFCKEMNLSYPTLKRWLGPAATKPVQFVEVGGAEPGEGRLSIALPNGLWAEFPLDADRSVVAGWIRELKAC
ncbi:transposase [Pelagicoccus sp. SDUM812005]|uniref:IS66 family insertion sequence element accessory protein TnpA n=1 Tax=Pelagicoccus sp. SDUM812005 TaxID=3041257 RepID=UPI0028107D76|nr:transposase [Pelagicoccus sp. SDUM812005]MDQ8183899.1 transposase [Pelagicoccus sp. SDUM812005]